MITYVNDKEAKYEEDILKHLRAHNQKFAGKTLPGKRYFYVFEKDELIGAMKATKSWDWVTLKDMFYQDLDVLRFMVMKVCQFYEGQITGIKSFTTIKERYDDLVEVGLVYESTLEGTPSIDDCLYLTNRELNIASEVGFDYKESEDGIEEYNKILQVYCDTFNTKHHISDEEIKVSFVALDNETFAGGVVGYITLDSMYIDLLAVNEEYRHQGIGSKLMKQIEEYSKQYGIYSMNLGTAEFQAREFYEKLGYDVVMALEDYPKGYSCYTLVKKI